MSELYDNYFDTKKSGKMYQSEAEYIEDIYAFVDMCFAGLRILIVKYGQDPEKRERTHIREIPQPMEQSYDALLRRQPKPEDDAYRYVKEQLKAAREHVRGRLRFTPLHERRFKICLLCKRLSLSELEQFCLFLGYAASYDEKYGPIFADVQSPGGSTNPTFRLAVFLYSLYMEVDTKEAGYLLEQQSILFESFFDIQKDTSGKPESYGFALNRRTCSFLRGYEDLDKEIKRFAVYHSEDELLPELLIREENIRKAERVLEHFLQEDTKGNVLHVYGPDGDGKKLLLQKAAKQHGCGIIFADVEKIEKGTFEEIEIYAARLIQESILLHAVLCFVDMKDRDEAEGEALRRGDFIPPTLSYLLQLLAQKLSFFAWISLEKCQYLLKYPIHLLCMEQTMLSVGERIVLWQAFAKNYPVGKRVDLVMCANQYILSIKGIKEVLRTANYIRIQDGETKIEPEHVRLAVKQQSPNQLGRHATLINAVYAWDDLVVSEEQKHQMMLICNHLKYRNIVGEEWGFFKKTAYGRGICALFYGAPGTGKTMAVQVMANELGLDLYRVDLSQMVSKYVGETEKNIASLFKKAKNINALLFFDEADSLFAKRSEVRDSQDRHANTQTAYLLQKLEEYEGITILATNYINNIDDAFKRRIKFMVNFAFPEPSVRLELWNTILPQDVPCEEELDFEYYAEHFELSGSNIKEVLTNAAFIAASGQEKLANRHIIEAVKLNFSKYGKVLSDDDFGYLVSG